MYSKIIRPILFLIPPEVVHHIIVWALKCIDLIPGAHFLLRKIFNVSNPALSTTVLGLHFNNPVGLAAGFDKNADFFRQLEVFGFSFIEIGTVTPKPQIGNPKPRLFRLPKDKALINRMGFNNKGVIYASRLIQRSKKRIIIGGNIGKNTDTPNNLAVNDYMSCFKEIYDSVDYIVVNISCPNIKDLRELQEGGELKDILVPLIKDRAHKKLYKPILIKISPDISIEQLYETLKAAEEVGIDGYVATNTTTSRDKLASPVEKVSKIGNGGLSGLPLKQRSTEIIRLIHQYTNGKKPIIGVGGIMTPEDALDKLNAGASLIQIYTGFIYSGPLLIKRINQAIIKNHFN